MSKVFKRVTAALAATMVTGVLMTSASAYQVEDSWTIRYVNQLPNNPGNQDTAVVRVYGGGYQTYCNYDPDGGNDCRVTAKADGISEYIIAHQGFSEIKHYVPAGQSTFIYYFYGHSDSTCRADGTVGLYR